jgi:Fe-S-cluster-containing hydrogenase component 2
MRINPNKCVACGNCTYVCPMGAIYVDPQIKRATVKPLAYFVRALTGAMQPFGEFTSGYAPLIAFSAAGVATVCVFAWEERARESCAFNLERVTKELAA